MKKHLSINFDDRPAGMPVDTLVIHYTGMKTAEEALNRLQDGEAKVSAHYFIDEEGEVIQLVQEKNRAWHAGVSSWRGRENVNDFSIGIELVNPGHEFGYKHFEEPQMNALIKLCKEIMERHPIESQNVVGHSDIAPDRKEDPGEFFEWERLSNEGIGFYVHHEKNELRHVIVKAGTDGKDVKNLQERLAKYGYGIKIDGVFGEKTAKVVMAFQRHFYPARFWTAKTDSMWDRQVWNELAWESVSWDDVSDHTLEELLKHIS